MPERKGPLAVPFRPKKHQEERFIPYVMKVELGILQASKVDPTLADDDMKETLRLLMRAFKRSGPGAADCDAARAKEIAGAVQGIAASLVADNLAQALDENGSLPAEDVIGVLSTAKGSISPWSQGPRSRSYLAFLEEFFAGMGIVVQVTGPEEDK